MIFKWTLSGIGENNNVIKFVFCGNVLNIGKAEAWLSLCWQQYFRSVLFDRGLQYLATVQQCLIVVLVYN